MLDELLLPYAIKILRHCFEIKYARCAGGIIDA